MWGDWAAHFTYINHFRVIPVTQWFAHNPIFAAAGFVYPPLSSILSALLMRMGVSLKWATVAPSMVLSMWLLAELWRWLRVHRLSERATWAGVTLFLLSGAWGWGKWLGQVRAQAARGVWEALAFPSEFVTKDFDHFLDWVNPVVSMVLPQRAFLLGFPLFLLILRIIKQRINTTNRKFEWSTGIDLGLLSFVLFLAHTHSFLALGFLCAWWMMLFPKHWRFWLSYAVSTGLLVIPWYWAILRSDVGTQVFSLNLGWMAPTPLTLWGWSGFWLLNWGIFLPLIGLGLFRLMLTRQQMILRWFLPFFAIFVLVNIVQTQRWEWDNTKFFVVSLIGLLPLIVDTWQVLIRFIQKQKLLIRIPGLTLMLVLFGLQVLPGFLDFLHLSQPWKIRWDIASAVDVRFAEQVEQRVPATAIILTGDLHNQPVSMLAGRTLFLGFKGWVWSYGLDYRGYDTAVDEMYTNPLSSARLMKEHNLRYVVVGPHESWQFKGITVPEQNCALLIEVGEQRMFDCLTWRESSQ